MATHALSIFGDHSDVMAARSTGVAMLASGSPQEAQDLAAIGHAATLRRAGARSCTSSTASAPRTRSRRSPPLDDATLRALIDADAVAAHRAPGAVPRPPGRPRHRAEPRHLLPGPRGGQPVLRRAARPSSADTMDRFAELTGRRYRLFDYVGHPEAERVVVLMGSGAECAHETVDHLVAPGRARRAC